MSNLRETLSLQHEGAVERPRSGYALIAIAIVIVTVEMLRYWLLNHPLHWPPQAIAFVFGFVGFYIRNPRQTLKGALFLVNSATGFIAVVRTGRRAEDIKAVPLGDETLPPTKRVPVVPEPSLPPRPDDGAVG